MFCWRLEKEATGTPLWQTKRVHVCCVCWRCKNLGVAVTHSTWEEEDAWMLLCFACSLLRPRVNCSLCGSNTPAGCEGEDWGAVFMRGWSRNLLSRTPTRTRVFFFIVFLFANCRVFVVRILCCSPLTRREKKVSTTECCFAFCAGNIFPNYLQKMDRGTFFRQKIAWRWWHLDMSNFYMSSWSSLERH